jgi:ribosome maturation factor RimP
LRKRAKSPFSFFKRRKKSVKGYPKKSKLRHPASGTGELKPEKPEETIARVWEIAEPACISAGFELVQVEYRREPGGRILRLYIDKPGGVTVDDCATVSRQVGDLLDVYLEGTATYNLEVSSPGIERPLAKRSDYERFKGKEARIMIRRPKDGQKNFKGILLGASGEEVELRMEGGLTVAIPFGEITKARLVNYNGED